MKKHSSLIVTGYFRVGGGDKTPKSESGNDDTSGFYSRKP
jgi:hypothetical protein